MLIKVIHNLSVPINPLYLLLNRLNLKTNNNPKSKLLLALTNKIHHLINLTIKIRTNSEYPLSISTWIKKIPINQKVNQVIINKIYKTLDLNKYHNYLTDPLVNSWILYLIHNLIYNQSLIIFSIILIIKIIQIL